MDARTYDPSYGLNNGKRPPSSFTTPNTNADGSAPKTDYPVVTLSQIIPPSANIGTILYPDENFKLKTIEFPALAAKKAPIKIKYRSAWQNKAKNGGVRSGSIPPGYLGYRGRQLSFTAVLNSFDPRTVGEYSVSDTITILRSWATLEIVEAKQRIRGQRLAILLKKEVDEGYRKAYSLRGASLLAGRGSFDRYPPNTAKKVELFAENWSEQVESAKLENFRNPFTVKKVFELSNPLPPLPLEFRFGALKMVPCVISKATINVLRFSEGLSADDSRQIDMAEITLVLQEVSNMSLWDMNEEPKEVSYVHARTKNAPGIVTWLTD